MRTLPRWMAGSSFRKGPVSSRTSLSVRPVYLNLVPQENIEPPLTTGASEARGKLWIRYIELEFFYVSFRYSPFCHYLITEKIKKKNCTYPPKKNLEA